MTEFRLLTPSALYERPIEVVTGHPGISKAVRRRSSAATPPVCFGCNDLGPSARRGAVQNNNRPGSSNDADHQ